MFTSLRPLAFIVLAGCSPPPSNNQDSATGDENGGASSLPPLLGAGGAIAWPEGRKAAVSLTYDDGLDGQLVYAVPALASHHLRATFFLASFPGIDHVWSLPNTTYELSARHRAWAAVAESGHELGAHTIHHPCASNGSHFRPEDYDLARMAKELDESQVRLARLGAVAPYTFAYPCEGDRVGLRDGESYAPLIAARFLAARTSRVGVSGPGRFDLQQVAQRFGDTSGASAAELIAYVDEAIERGGWAVFTFHGIGPETLGCNINEFALEKCALNYLTTSSEAHTALLDYLLERQSEVWTTTFKEVAELRTAP